VGGHKHAAKGLAGSGFGHGVAPPTSSACSRGPVRFAQLAEQASPLSRSELAKRLDGCRGYLANQLVRLDIDNPPPSSEIKVVGLWTANLYEAGSAVF